MSKVRYEVHFNNDEDEGVRGWYIVGMCEDGTHNFDAIGPYDTEEEAKDHAADMNGAE